MVRRTIVLSLIATLSFGLLAAQPVSAQSPMTALRALTVPVEGVASGLGAFTGTANVTDFLVQNGQLMAAGTLTGVIRDAEGNAVRSIVSSFQTEVTNVAAAAPGTCGILHLELGPINLNLLGLALDTNLIVVDLSAVPGAGNLLGNLLCSITNLLNSGGTLSNLSRLLDGLLLLL